MRLIKAIFLAATLVMANSALALTDDEQVELANAIEAGNVATVKRFIKDGIVDVNKPAFGWTWLQVAATKNQLEIVKVLVESGSDLGYRHPITKATALAQAALTDNKDIVAYLLSKGADPNVKLRANVALLRAVRDQGYTEMAALLEKNGAVDDGCHEEKCF